MAESISSCQSPCKIEPAERRTPDAGVKRLVEASIMAWVSPGLAGVHGDLRFRRLQLSAGGIAGVNPDGRTFPRRCMPTVVGKVLETLSSGVIGGEEFEPLSGLLAS